MIRIASLVLILQSLCAFSAQLDLALVEYPEGKTVEALQTALAGVNLADITNADRTITSVSYLRGGNVLFARSTSVTAPLDSSTRLGNSRVDLTGSLQNNMLNVEIRLSEGIDAGLHRFSTRTYKGSALLSPGSPRVIGLRILKGKCNSMTKSGGAVVKETVKCHAILAQWR